MRRFKVLSGSRATREQIKGFKYAERSSHRTGSEQNADNQ